VDSARSAIAVPQQTPLTSDAINGANENLDEGQDFDVADEF